MSAPARRNRAWLIVPVVVVLTSLWDHLVDHLTARQSAVAFLLLCWLVVATLFARMWWEGRRGPGDGEHHL